MKKEGAINAGLFAAVLGVLAVALPIANFPLGIFLGSVVGIVLGIIALVIGIKSNKLQSNTWAKAGMTLGIIGIVLSVILLVWALAFLAALANQVGDLQQQGYFDQLQAAQQLQSQLGGAE